MRTLRALRARAAVPAARRAARCCRMQLAYAGRVLPWQRRRSHARCMLPHRVHFSATWLALPLQRLGATALHGQARVLAAAPGRQPRQGAGAVPVLHQTP